ncbi:MAG: PDZ domain-containing protein [Acidimicrobiales bacterium]|nr:PDZ domain-containing protein [Acidimicrobiales bacterium]
MTDDDNTAPPNIAAPGATEDTAAPGATEDTAAPGATEDTAAQGATADTLPSEVGVAAQSIWQRFFLWWLALGVLLFMVASTAIAFSIITVPYYLLEPGAVRPTSDAIIVEGTEAYPPEGEIDFTTVAIRRDVTVWEWIFAKLDDSVDIVDKEVIDGDRTADEQRRYTQLQMSQSQDDAVFVALSYLGYEPQKLERGAMVTSLVAELPSAEVLELGDIVVGFDGQPVDDAQGLIALTSQASPGDVVEMEVLRAGSADPVTVEVTLVEHPDPERPDAAFIGIGLNEFNIDVPFEVSIDVGSVRGPSAGLAFTLGIIDVLTPGELTGGRHIATTGTIDRDGNVGRVGGVPQKTVAARESGVEVFIVPSSEYDEAIEYAGDMEVRPVDTLEEALAVLAEVGGDVPSVPSDLAAPPTDDE